MQANGVRKAKGEQIRDFHQNHVHLKLAEHDYLYKILFASTTEELRVECKKISILIEQMFAKQMDEFSKESLELIKQMAHIPELEDTRILLHAYILTSLSILKPYAQHVLSKSCNPAGAKLFATTALITLSNAFFYDGSERVHSVADWTRQVRTKYIELAI